MTDTEIRNPDIEHLAAAVMAGSYSADTHTVDVCWYSGVPVDRTGSAGPYKLTLGMEPGQVDLTRLNNGAPLLNAHSDAVLSDVIGVVDGAWVANGKGFATVRFSQRPDVHPIEQDVASRIVRNVSVGTYIRKRKDITPEGEPVRHFLAMDHEPREISLTPVPADPGAQTLSARETKLANVNLPEPDFFPAITRIRAMGAEYRSIRSKIQSIIRAAAQCKQPEMALKVRNLLLTAKREDIRKIAAEEIEIFDKQRRILDMLH
jgi:hypothetical protein